MVRRVKSLKHAKNEVRFERVFMKITKIFAKITREAPGFFGGPSSLNHEVIMLMKTFCFFYEPALSLAFSSPGPSHVAENHFHFYKIFSLK